MRLRETSPGIVAENPKEQPFFAPELAEFVPCDVDDIQKALAEIAGPEYLEGRHWEVFVVDETPSQTVIGVAKDRVGDEPGGDVTPGAERLSERGEGGAQGGISADANFMRPSSSEHACMRWKCPGGRCAGPFKFDTFAGQPHQVG